MQFQETFEACDSPNSTYKYLGLALYNQNTLKKAIQEIEI
jgi:hypothetical protein